jgi:hypothetical protein
MRHILLAAAAMTLASCSNDIEPAGGERLPDGKYPLNITATVEGMTSRAGGERQAFQTGDAIGVRIGEAATAGVYTMTAEGAMEAETPLYWQTSAEATVTAWYPAGGTTVSLADQSSADFTPVDFLWAETTASYLDNPLSLTFHHRMAKVKYKLINEAGISAADWPNVAVKIYGCTSVISDADGNLTGSKEDWITPGATETWLYPQDMTGKQLIRVTAKIDGQNKTFAYTPTDEKDGNITPGCIHTYTITVKRDRIEVQSVTGGKWTDNGEENIGSKDVLATYTADQLKPGDFFYRTPDGSWATSDGGLRTVYTDGTVRMEDVDVDTKIGTCIGIVFHSGHNEKDDKGCYSGVPFKDGTFHGYVMALTDVGSLTWGPYEETSGVSTDNSDWKGYSNHKILVERGIGNYPAANGCRDYGTDNDGKYQAPINTTGWFLPSYGQLRYLYSNRALLSSQINRCKEKIAGQQYCLV